MAGKICVEQVVKMIWIENALPASTCNKPSSTRLAHRTPQKQAEKVLEFFDDLAPWNKTAPTDHAMDMGRVRRNSMKAPASVSTDISASEN
jgi:hypothetical protein